MPKIKERLYPPTKWMLSTGCAVGTKSSDFFIIGASSFYDEHFSKTDPATDAYTHILHFKDLKICNRFTAPERMYKFWQSREGKTYLIGNAEGIYEVSPSGLNEIAMPGLPGVFTAIWGTDESHIFVCGIFNSFVMYRRYGEWTHLKVPRDKEGYVDLHAIVGFNENDVYFVGRNGAIVHFDGTKLKHLESPTTNTLVSICLLDDKFLCLAGYGGILLYGNKNGWRSIPTGTDEPILSLARYNNSVCFPSTDGVYSFDGHRSPQLIVPQHAEWINGFDDALTLNEDMDTWIFDGETLTKLDVSI